MKVNLSEIIEAIEMMDQFSECFIDQETGKIEWVSEMAMRREEQEKIYDMLDEHVFYRLPSSYDFHEYGIMEDFIDTRSGKEYDRLSSAIHGRGAFRRFKDCVYDLGIDQDWYDYQQAAYKQKAIRWCEDNGLEYDEK